MIFWLLRIHIMAIILSAFGILMADAAAFKWLRGKAFSVSHAAAMRAHWIVTIGLSTLVLSGLSMFWLQKTYLIGQPLFWLKMFFVFALLVNAFFIEALMPLAERQPFAALPLRQKTLLLFSGAVSTVSWVGSFTAASLLFGWLW